MGIPISNYGNPIPTPNGIEELITGKEASQLFGIELSTIRKWKQRGIIKPAGIDRSGRHLYRLYDLAVCERETRVQSGRQNRLDRALDG